MGRGLLAMTLTTTMGIGGDGLVTARHLFHYGYHPTIFYPKPTKSEIYERLATQLRNLDIPFTEDFEGALKQSNHVVDAIFGIFVPPLLLLLLLLLLPSLLFFSLFLLEKLVSLLSMLTLSQASPSAAPSAPPSKP